MAYVEDTNGFPHRYVLLVHAGVLDRHLPTAELRHARAQREMSIMHRRTAKRGSHERRRYRIASAPMTTVSLTKTALSDVKADAIVIGVAKGASGLELAPGSADVDKAFKKRLVPALKALGAKGAAGEVTKLASLGAVGAPAVVAVGLGPAPRKGGRFGPGAPPRGLRGAGRSPARPPPGAPPL